MSHCKKACMSYGFTLIESLIALFVLSVGGLALLALQLKGVQYAHSGYQRALATLIAVDFQERVWVGLRLHDGSCNDASDFALTGMNVWSRASADYDSRETLPGVVVTVSDISSNCVIEIKVEWDEDRFAPESGGEEFLYKFRVPADESWPS